MNELEKIIEEIKKNKEQESDSIILEGKKEAEKIISNFQKEAEEKFSSWFNEEKKKMVQWQKQEVYQYKLSAQKEILSCRERIINKVFDELRAFLEDHPAFLPEKEIIGSHNVIREKIGVEDFINFIKDEYIDQINKFLDI